MPKPKAEKRLADGIVSTVFHDFIEALSSDPTVPGDVPERLRTVFLEDRDLSVDAIRKAALDDASGQPS